MSKSRHTRDGKFTVLSCSGLIQPEQYEAGERLQQQVNNRHTGKKKQPCFIFRFKIFKPKNSQIHLSLKNY